MEQNKQEGCTQCSIVEKVLSIRIEGLEGRVKEHGGDLQQLQREVDGSVGELWKNLRETMEEINKTISDHTAADSTAMHNIETQLLARVPAWALAVMTIGASIIGAMATYILDHLK